MNRYSREYPGLEHLMGAYFHQDWDLNGKTWEEVVRFYCANEIHLTGQRVIDDIEALLIRVESEAELEGVLAAFGSSYYCGDGDHALRRWLFRVREMIANYRG